MRTYRKIRIWLAIKILWLRPYFLTKNEQEKLIMMEFRSLVSLFGFDISDISDEDIKKCAIAATKEISKAGLSASEVGEAFGGMALA